MIKLELNSRTNVCGNCKSWKILKKFPACSDNQLKSTKQWREEWRKRKLSRITFFSQETPANKKQQQWQQKDVRSIWSRSFREWIMWSIKRENKPKPELSDHDFNKRTARHALNTEQRDLFNLKLKKKSAQSGIDNNATHH